LTVGGDLADRRARVLAQGGNRVNREDVGYTRLPAAGRPGQGFRPLRYWTLVET